MLEKVEAASSFCGMNFFLRTEVVIRPTNNRNLQRNNCCATSCKKMLPYLILRLYKSAVPGVQMVEGCAKKIELCRNNEGEKKY